MGSTYQAAAMTPHRARAILAVTPEASPQEIERAFRLAMRASHPDRGGDAGRAQLLLDARRCLRADRSRGMDAERRVVVVPAATRRDRVTALLTRLRLLRRPTRVR
ncbi:J domain-containing protein [Acidimicrobiia bacterium EGI L10123]|uniref:J domain-containing protein n=1 Tax=Salinilacustrithrix flava TaxID=2957203 RepID=UPI003D7C2D88|nr:J domain-containing protein [Acidimicrobiia bacterium EGI L10123]